MKPADSTRDKPTEIGQVAYWLSAVLFGMIILASHGFDQIRARGKVTEWVGENWEFFYYIATFSGDLAFICLFVLLIWFVRNRSLVFVIAILLAFANWGENELISRAFFGGFFKTIDKWQWETIDSCVAIIMAIGTMPLVKRLTRSDREFTRSLSVADIMLMTLATAVLITAVENIATLVHGDTPTVFAGWDSTIHHVISSALLCVVGLTVVYAAFLGRLRLGIFAYLLASVAYIFLTSFVLTGITNGVLKWENKKLTFDSIVAGEYNHYLPVISLFLLYIFAARLTTQFFANWPRVRTSS